jgi:hypothetical protein
MTAGARLALAAALCVADGAGAAERPPLLCGGQTPHWALEIGAEAATFTAPGRAQIDYAIPHETRAEGRDWPQVLTLLAPQDTALALIRPAACGAGGWMIDLLTQQDGEAIALTGCCRARRDED